MEYLVDGKDYYDVPIDIRLRMKPFYRCKECKHYGVTEYGKVCQLSARFQPRKSPIDYCSNAEEKE